MSVIRRSTRRCKVCGEETDTPRGAVGRGRRPLYGRICVCEADRKYDDADIAGVLPMAEIVWKVLGREPASPKTMRVQFARLRDSGARNPNGSVKYHTYPNDTSCVSSLQAWGDLHAEDMSAVRDRRITNLRQFQTLAALTAAPDPRARGANVGGGTNATSMGETLAD